MRKPKDFIQGLFEVSEDDNPNYLLNIYDIYFGKKSVKELIKWLEKVQKYNEFKNKKVKKVK